MELLDEVRNKFKKTYVTLATYIEIMKRMEDDRIKQVELNYKGREYLEEVGDETGETYSQDCGDCHLIHRLNTLALESAVEGGEFKVMVTEEKGSPVPNTKVKRWGVVKTTDNNSVCSVVCHTHGDAKITAEISGYEAGILTANVKPKGSVWWLWVIVAAIIIIILIYFVMRKNPDDKRYLE